MGLFRRPAVLLVNNVIKPVLGLLFFMCPVYCTVFVCVQNICALSVICPVYCTVVVCVRNICALSVMCPVYCTVFVCVRNICALSVIDRLGVVSTPLCTRHEMNANINI